MPEWKTLPQTRKDAWWVWTALQAKMHHVCAWLEAPTELYECSLPYLKPDDVICLVQPRFEQLMISYRTAGRDCLMNVVFDPDLLSVRFAIDDEIRGRELLIVCRREQSLLMDENGTLLNEDQAAEHMVRSLLIDGQPPAYNAARRRGGGFDAGVSSSGRWGRATRRWLCWGRVVSSLMCGT